VSRGSFSGVSHHPTSTTTSTPPSTTKSHGIDELRRNYERTVIMIALQKNNWNRRLAAEMLRITRRGLTYKMKALHIDITAIPHATIGRPRDVEVSDSEAATG